MADSAGAARTQIFAAALLFSTGGAAIKAVSMTGWQVACLRSGVAVAGILVLLPAARRRWRRFDLAVGLTYAGALISYALANRLTTAANTIFLQSTAPLYVLFLGPWLLREPLRRRDLAFMAVVAAGMALFFVDTEATAATAPRPLAGNLLAAAGGVFWALTVVGMRWAGRAEGGGSAAASVAAGNAIAALVCLPAALPFERAAAVDWVVVLYLGVFQIGLAYVFLTRGLRRLQAFEVSLLLLVEPVLNPLWAWWLHAETPNRWAVAGGALILAATVVKTLRGFVVERLRGRRLQESQTSRPTGQ